MPGLSHVVFRFFLIVRTQIWIHNRMYLALLKCNMYRCAVYQFENFIAMDLDLDVKNMLRIRMRTEGSGSQRFWVRITGVYTALITSSL
jgi:hypothetical protein